MKNKIINIVLVSGIAMAIAFTPVAFAGHKKHNNHHGSRVTHHYSNNHYSHHNNHYRSYHKRHHGSGHVLGAIIGGVILGSIISDVKKHHNVTYRNNSRYDNNYRYANNFSSNYYNTPLRVNKTIILNNTPTQTYRVLNGQDCYLVNYNDLGAEVLTLVPKTNCGF